MKSSLKELYLRWFSGKASEQEQAELFNRAADEGPTDELNDAMYEAWNALFNDTDAIQSGRSSIAERVVKLFPAEAPVKRINRRWWAIAAAAAVIALVGTGIFVMQTRQPAKQQVVNNRLPDKEPAQDGARLQLADGSVITLDSMSDGLITHEGNTAVKLSGGKLIYDAGASTELKYNTMTTPAGRKFRLTLPDGTQVWLNAASSLRYPTAFAGDERLVEIKGEAYFEVSRDAAKPFRVKTDGQLIEVLGTRFNVNAYEDDHAVSTTLLSGSVSVKSAGNAPVLLQPRLQAVSDRNSGQTEVATADTLDVMAWKEGVFRFHNTPLILIMQQLQRWYDVRVEGDIPNMHFTGVISRNSPLTKVLHFLQFTSEQQNVRFVLTLQPPGSREKDRITIIK
ncbi:DUF4974 domain-containing protein [Pseudoflavitalea sp. G-6-1-2]|uniref:FecR family protein n=1 Tax=Pseudoflavitalea sp. G-6-1-2 TaxID=2728841 RepID=UPI00146BC836|nr:FecR family protein [Pseudoflavitalea sp. G-6-1-2]NML22995.1 DUF4974 domain-containing protein [Pseudoflavitalea sp. G-6-1-2]